MPAAFNLREKAMKPDKTADFGAQADSPDHDARCWLEDEDYCLECDETDARELSARHVSSLQRED